MTELTFTRPNNLFMNANGREHFFTRSEKTRVLRELACALARARKTRLYAPPPYHVTCTITLDTARRFDPPNAYPTVKALIDGLTDAGIWQDDNSDVIKVMSFQRGQGKAERGMKEITITIASIKA